MCVCACICACVLPALLGVSASVFIVLIVINVLVCALLQESSDSSNTTIEDEDVKGKLRTLRASKTFSSFSYSRQIKKWRQFTFLQTTEMFTFTLYSHELTYMS